MFNNQIIFYYDNKDDLHKIKHHDNLLLIYEKGVRPIINRFRNKKFNKAYSNYKQTITIFKDEIIWKGIPQHLKT